MPTTMYDTSHLLKIIEENDIELFIFDFDETITIENTRIDKPALLDQKRVLANTKNFIVDVFQEMAKTKKIAIASFASTKTIEKYLQLLFGEDYKKTVVAIRGNNYELGCKSDMVAKLASDLGVAAKKAIYFDDDHVPFQTLSEQGIKCFNGQGYNFIAELSKKYSKKADPNILPKIMRPSKNEEANNYIITLLPEASQKPQLHELVEQTVNTVKNSSEDVSIENAKLKGQYIELISFSLTSDYELNEGKIIESLHELKLFEKTWSIEVTNQLNYREEPETFLNFVNCRLEIKPQQEISEIFPIIEKKIKQAVNVENCCNSMNISVARLISEEMTEKRPQSLATEPKKNNFKFKLALCNANSKGHFSSVIFTAPEKNSMNNPETFFGKNKQSIDQPTDQAETEFKPSNN